MDILRLTSLTEGGILGAAVGDALGVPAEFMEREELECSPVTGMRSGGAHGQPCGTWSDDTSMTLCTMHSMVEKGIDHGDLMSRFSDWLFKGEYTARGETFDVGGSTRAAIMAYAQGTPPLMCGEAGEYSCGNGSLMRILPAALYIMGRCGGTLSGSAAKIIHGFSRCTHAHPRCLMACGVYCAVAFELCRGANAADAVKDGVRSALAYYRGRAEFGGVYAEFLPLEDVGAVDERHIESSGYVMHTLYAALWCLINTQSYAECVLRAVNLGSDSDTTAAVAGGLAGLHYGEGGIPEEWAEATAGYDEIKALCGRFAAACAL